MDLYADEVAIRLRMYQAQAARTDRSPGRSKREQFLWKRIWENLIAAYQTELDWVTQTQQEFRTGKF